MNFPVCFLQRTSVQIVNDLEHVEPMEAAQV